MKKVLSLFISCILLAVSIPVMPEMTVSAANMFTVDCANVLREATHCASGSLYGVIEDKPVDVDGLIAPLNPYVFRNPARGSWGNQHPFGDAIKVAKRLSSIPSAKVSIDLADMLPYWPYQWPGMQSWLNQVRSFAKDKMASGCTNWYGYEIWNEPDGTWKDSNGCSFNELWKQTYRALREIDPNEKIVGPCDSWYQESRMRSFLQFCQANDCMPDIMSWHELSGIDRVAKDLKSYRNLEKSLGMKELPISINEYCDEKHELEGQPGSCAQFFGKFERYKVDSGLISWWFVPQPGRLGSLLATDTQKGAGWYLFKWYGDMKGNMVYVTPPNDNSKLVDGCACVDSDSKCVSFIFGGQNDGTINTTFKNLPDFIGDTANVKIEKIDWVSKDTVSYGPSLISSKNYAVSNGQLNVNLSGCNSSSGYRIYITKAGEGPIETQAPAPSFITPTGTFKLINKNSQKVLAVNGDSTANGANVLQWSDNGKTGQQWIITDEGNGCKLINVNAKKALDVDNNSMENGGNVLIWTDNDQANQRWFIRDAGNGYVTLQNQNSGKMLDVEKSSIADGANVLQWDDNGGSNQLWKLVPVGDTVPSTSPKPSPSPEVTKSPEVTPSPAVTPSPVVSPSTEKALAVTVKGDSWDGGYNANVTLNNTSTKHITNWKLEFNASEVSMNSLWCAKSTVSSGKIVLTAESYNAAISSSGSTTFGFGGNGKMPGIMNCTVSYEMDGKWQSYESGIVVK